MNQATGEGFCGCPHCGRTEHQVKAGLNGGNQRYKCVHCGRRYTPAPRPRGHGEAARREAVRLRAQGLTTREIGQRLGVTARSVANWLRREADPADADAVAALPTGESGTAFVPSRQRPTIRDVAERAGVSTSTVSNYLNQKGRMSGATVTRIQAAVEALHFTPSFLVRAIRQRRTRVLGVLTFGLGELDSGAAITPPLLTGLDLAADAAAHDLLLYTGWTDRPHRHSAQKFLDGQVDGLLWVAPALREPILERVAAAGLPAVGLLTRRVPEGVGCVGVDNFGAMRTLVNHLVSLGHTRIAFLGLAHASDYQDRRDGYRQAVVEAGLAWDRGLEATPRENIWEWDFFEAALTRWQALPAPPTAILAADDGAARLTIEALHRRGLRVPEDIAVTGFNDEPDSRHAFGGLTTMRQPFREIGRLGMERLIALVEGAPVRDCRLTVPAELVVRASTAGNRSPSS